MKDQTKFTGQSAKEEFEALVGENPPVMKTAAQHNAASLGAIDMSPTQADAETALQAPTKAALAARRLSKEALEKQNTELTAERDALKSLVRDLRDGAEQTTAGRGLMMEAVAEVRSES